MINVEPTQNRKFRTFGWVQDPSDFRSLCDVVSIFDPNSLIHTQLRDNIIPELISEADGRNELILALNRKPLRVSYSELVGTSFTPRSSARCNGIVQATVKGQTRPFIGDWPADNFVRWAQAFGFIKYRYIDDTFEITETGLTLSAARTAGKEINNEEKEILITAILAYPPAVRILNLLSQDDSHLTKFELGKRLGFIGEDGFTSLPQTILIKALATTDDIKEKNKMKTDWDGSADKYARMISKWLQKLGLVEQLPKTLTVTVAGRKYTDTIGQAYTISAAGIVALNRTTGRSRHRKIRKNVSYEMMATKGSDREYRRTRRTYILKAISESQGRISFNDIKSYLCSVGLNEQIETIKDDVGGLIFIGLNITVDNEFCIWNDAINDFCLPLTQTLTKSNLSEIKDKIRPQITNISHEYLSLIDLAYDSSQNRLFEMKTLELLTEECCYSGLHLGGSRKPDGIIFTTELDNNYGVIIDTKAYSKGYNLPISQADEMERYVRENQTRDINVNSNEWWSNFGDNINEYFFMFVAGHFTGNFASQLKRISLNTGVNGTALNVVNLLLCANSFKAGVMTHQKIQNDMFVNNEFSF